MKLRNLVLVAALIIAVASTGAIYAANTWFFNSPSVKYINLSGSVELSLDGVSWDSANVTVVSSESWFARFVLTSDFSGNLSVTWVLQKFVSGVWVNQALVKNTFAIVSEGRGPIIYCTPIGSVGDNFDWGKNIPDLTPGASYRVSVTLSWLRGNLP